MLQGQSVFGLKYQSVLQGQSVFGLKYQSALQGQFVLEYLFVLEYQECQDHMESQAHFLCLHVQIRCLIIQGQLVHVAILYYIYYDIDLL